MLSPGHQNKGTGSFLGFLDWLLIDRGEVAARASQDSGGCSAEDLDGAPGGPGFSGQRRDLGDAGLILVASSRQAVVEEDEDEAGGGLEGNALVS